MRLARLSIEGYRAIRRLELELEELTALIGENGFGKTSLLDALLTCLGPGAGEPVFAPGDFHVPPPPDAPADEVRISLHFVETRADERQARPALTPALVGPPGQGELLVRIEARRGADQAASVKARVSFCDPEGRPLAPRPPAGTLAALREACPAIVLRAGRYFLAPTRSAGAEGSSGLAADADLEREVLRAYAGLSDSHEPTPDLQAGIDAASALVARYADQGRRRRAQVPRTTRVLESLAQAPGGRGRLATRTVLPAPGGGAQGLAALLVVGALFRARGEARSLAGTDPLLVVEDPEAHLHPVVAANLSRLIDSMHVQRLLTTNSGDLLASVPLRSLRRAVRGREGVRVHQVARRALSIDEQRRVGYHVRANRADALFARCWLLVEGESEFWLLPELARLLGVDLPSEGVRVVEFAQCGVEPLIKLADALGIGWHLLADGDPAGQRYAERARARTGGRPGCVTLLEERDIEHCLWAYGLDDVFRRVAGIKGPQGGGRRRTLRQQSPREVIARAIDKTSKPRLALTLLEALGQRGAAQVPPPLRGVIEDTVALARRAERPGAT